MYIYNIYMFLYFVPYIKLFLNIFICTSNMYVYINIDIYTSEYYIGGILHCLKNPAHIFVSSSKIVLRCFEVLLLALLSINVVPRTASQNSAQ